MDNVYFSRVLLKVARTKFYRVYVDKYNGFCYKGSVNGVKGCRVRIYPTQLQFNIDSASYCYSNNELAGVINDYR